MKSLLFLFDLISFYFYEKILMCCFYSNLKGQLQLMAFFNVITLINIIAD